MVRTAGRLLHPLLGRISSIGIWGQQHLRYIKTERKALYTELLTSGRLKTYLADINEQATEQMLLLTKHIAEREGVTEQLKAQDKMCGHSG